MQENGFAARLLMALPPRSTKRWKESEIPEKNMREYQEVFKKLS